MKIVFLGLASYYTPNMSYQDNCFNQVLLEQGHEVCYISNPEAYSNGRLVDVEPGTFNYSDGLELIRVPYRRILTSTVTKKLRMFYGVDRIIREQKPDIIFCHDACFYPVLDVLRYKLQHPEVKLYVDMHTAYYNSARTWASLNILHKLYYKHFYKRLEPYVERFFYIGTDEERFAREVYKIHKAHMSFLPLGGFCPTEEEYSSLRASAREELSLNDNDILLVHTGKMDQKKKTESLLHAFSSCTVFPGKLVLIGSIPQEMRDVLIPYIESNPRILYLGWKRADELRRYLCACDLYIQPGSVSATMQNAICCRCPIIAFPHEGYLNSFDFGGVAWVRDEKDMKVFFREITAKPWILQKMSRSSELFGRERLDYHTLVRQFVQTTQLDGALGTESEISRPNSLREGD